MKTIVLNECKLAFSSALVWRLDDGSDHRDFMNYGKPGSFHEREFEVSYQNDGARITVENRDGFESLSYLISSLTGVRGLRALIGHVGEDNHSFEFQSLNRAILVTVSTTKVHSAPGGVIRYLVPDDFSAIELDGLLLDWEQLEIDNL